MPEEKSKQSSAPLIENVWGMRQSGMDFPLDQGLKRTPNKTDVEYLCNYVYPFLHIMDSEAKFEKEFELKFIVLPNKWVIYDYGEVLSSALPYAYRIIKNANAGNIKEEEESAEGGEDGEGGHGTVTMQQVDVAYAMIKEAQDKGWAAVQLLNGTQLMQFYAWLAAKELGIEFKGFSPTAEQEKHQKIISENKKLEVAAKQKLANNQ